MKTIIKILLAAFVLSVTPTTHVSAQTKIETPAERKARLEREAAEKRRKQQQENATKRQREEAESKRREAEEQAAKEQAAREQAELARLLRELDENMVYVEGGTYKMGRHYFYSHLGMQALVFASPFDIFIYHNLPMEKRG